MRMGSFRPTCVSLDAALTTDRHVTKRLRLPACTVIHPTATDIRRRQDDWKQHCVSTVGLLQLAVVCYADSFLFINALIAFKLAVITYKTRSIKIQVYNRITCNHVPYDPYRLLTSVPRTSMALSAKCSWADPGAHIARPLFSEGKILVIYLTRF